MCKSLFALVALAAALPVRADHVFQFAPPTIVAPDSRAFANATTGEPGLLAAGTVVLDGVTGQPRYNFLDRWLFTLEPGADLVAFAGTINFTDPTGAVTFGIDNLQINLVGPAGVVVGWQQAVNFTGFQQLFSVVSQTPFVAGEYTLGVRGLLVGPQSAYAGTLQALPSAIPLPASLPLMATALAAMGLLLRQRMRDRG